MTTTPDLPRRKDGVLVDKDPGRGVAVKVPRG